MTAPLCDQCRQKLFPCDIASNLTTCVECARRALRAARAHTRAVVVFTSEPPVAPAIAAIPSTRPLGKITPEEWAVFTSALTQVARGGVVHQNDVRPLIRGRIFHKHIGPCYTRAMSMGLLRELSREPSGDRAGRNTHHDSAIYALSTNAKGIAA